MQTLADAGVVVDVIACNERLIDLSTVRVEHDLYVLRQISGVSMSLAGALHAQGAAIVNPYPVTVALRDKVIAASARHTAPHVARRSMSVWLQFGHRSRTTAQ